VGGDGAALPGLQVVERRREDWIQALGHWLRNPEEPGAAAAQAVAELYSSQSIALKALEGYEEVLWESRVLRGAH
jgi:hypothetical protein